MKISPFYPGYKNSGILALMQMFQIFWILIAVSMHCAIVCDSSLPQLSNITCINRNISNESKTFTSFNQITEVFYTICRQYPSIKISWRGFIQSNSALIILPNTIHEWKSWHEQRTTFSWVFFAEKNIWQVKGNCNEAIFTKAPHTRTWAYPLITYTINTSRKYPGTLLILRIGGMYVNAM